MKVKALILTLALSLAGAATTFAQSPLMGTWNLNEGKSTIPAGLQKNTKVIYQAQGDNIKVTTDGVGGDGQTQHTDWTGKFDGKYYPLTGDPTADSRAYAKIGDRTLALKNRKAGKVITSARITVSPDGKTRTLKASANANGKKLTELAVYDRE